MTLDCQSLLTLVLSGANEAVYAARSLRLGARGFVSKRATPEELLTALSEIANGHFYLSDTIKSRCLNALGPPSLPADSTPFDDISDGQLEVFHALGQGCDVHEVAVLMSVSCKAIELYRSQLVKKLGLESGRQLAFEAIAWQGFLAHG